MSTVTLLVVAAVREPDLNRKVWLPLPMIRRSVNVARPSEVVVATLVPPTVPLPLAMSAVMTTFALPTLLPLASWSWIAGCRLKGTPLVSVAEGWVVIASWASVPAVLTLTALDVAVVSPVALKVKVRLPRRPVIERLVKVASPLLLVVAVGVPPSVPPPVADRKSVV